MSAVRGWIDFTAWTPHDQHWYANFVVQSAGGDECAGDAVAETLDEVNAKPCTECVLLAGDMQTWYTDTAGKKWGDDRYKRYSTTTRPKIMLAHDLAWLRYGAACEDGKVVSHICGHPHCIRLEHNRYQSKDEDKADRDHHSLHGAGSIRPELLQRFPESC
jgi:hypothetical protein